MNRFVISLIALILLSCSDQGTSPQDRDFNILLRFGVGGRNELNTFRNTYTKDLVFDGTITVSLVLSESELKSIEAKLVETGFFNYPDTFTVKDSLTRTITPHSTYYFLVKRQSVTKTLFWNASIVPRYENVQVRNLEDIMAFISNIISRKPEVLNLPPARGGYI